MTTPLSTPRKPLFGTVLVANRGEIACRVIRTLRALGIRSVAVYSDADAGARHVREADAAVRIGPAAAAESYLKIEAIIQACRDAGADAVHPGYGFLSENVDFARALETAGITFIGPGVESLNIMGDKIRSKNHVTGYGVPVVPGIAEPGMSDAQLIEAADGVGYPLLIKPSAGGGGKGMHIVERPEELGATLATARRVAASAFGDDTLFLERLVTTPRHIEVQVLADNHGNVIHLGERECSLQRRHQKVIEEAPSPLLEALPDGAAIRARLGEAACQRRPQRQLLRRRHRGVPGLRQRPGRVLLYGDEHPAAGRASRHRDGHRRRPRRMAGPHRRRRGTHPDPGRCRPHRALRGGTRLRGSPGEELPALHRACAAPGRTPRTRAAAQRPGPQRSRNRAWPRPGGLGADPGPGDLLQLRPDDLQGDRVGAGPHRSPGHPG